MIEVGVAGATGPVGQHLVARLANHPWFRLTWVAASERSAGRSFGDIPWRIDAPRPDAAAALTLERAAPGQAPPIVFSALDAAAAESIEPALAAAGHLVVSNARTFRMHPDVPLVVPEINGESLALIDCQEWSGAIVTNPNCSTIFLAMALAPLRQFGIGAVSVSTLQALSGAGHPGVASLDALGNVIPFIGGEEEKIETETLKILGGRFPISAQTTRVPVTDGHTELVAVRLDRRVSRADLIEAWREFKGPAPVTGLPSAPVPPIVFVDGDDRPQPRLDLRRGDGMSVSIGRARECAVLGWKFVALGHNLVRGASGAAILNAELALATGVVSPSGVRRTVSRAL